MGVSIPLYPPECPELHTESPSQADHNFSFHKDAACDFPIVPGHWGCGIKSGSQTNLAKNKDVLFMPHSLKLPCLWLWNC